jgi:transposase
MEVAERLGVHEHAVGKWLRRFVRHGIDGLTDDIEWADHEQYRIRNWPR